MITTCVMGVCVGIVCRLHEKECPVANLLYLSDTLIRIVDCHVITLGVPPSAL